MGGLTQMALQMALQFRILFISAIIIILQIVQIRS